MEKGRLQCNAQNWLSRIRNQIENGWQQTHTHSTQWCMENSQRILFERKEEKERRRRRRIWIKRFLVKDKWGKWCTKEYTLEIFPLPISFIMHSQFKGVHKVFIILALSLCARGKITFCMFIVLAWSGFYFLCLLCECVCLRNIRNRNAMIIHLIFCYNTVFGVSPPLYDENNSEEHMVYAQCTFPSSPPPPLPLPPTITTKQIEQSFGRLTPAIFQRRFCLSPNLHIEWKW